MKDRKPVTSASSFRFCGANRCRAICICVTVAVVLASVILLSTLTFALYYGKQNEEFIKLQKSRETRSYLEKLIQNINQSPNLKWKAKYNPFGIRPVVYDPFDTQKFKNSDEMIADKIIDDIHRFHKSDLMQQHIRELMNFPAGELPYEFDARKKWPLCSSLHDVPNQGNCGSCFAVSVAGVASDRTCIATNGTVQVMLSTDDIIGCCDGCGDCFGGDPLKALVYWANEGLVTGGRDGCRPYPYDIDCGAPCSPLEFAKGAERRKCYRECQNIYYRNDYLHDKHYASIAYTMIPRTMATAGRGTVVIPAVMDHFNPRIFNSTAQLLTFEQILQILKKELYLFGPMTMAFPVTEEFMHYVSGIYSPYPETGVIERLIYWHVVRIIGWGHDADGLFYWIAVNSFGRSWGENGLFRVDISFLKKFGLEYEAAIV